ncbi:MAG TPA: regulatory protein RecX [Phytomonospora sp.]
MTRRARSGRGWDAAPPRAPRARRRSPENTTGTGEAAFGDAASSGAEPGDLTWFPEETEAAGARPNGPDNDETFRTTREDRRHARHADGGDTRTGASAAPAKPRDQGEIARDICLLLLSVRPRTRKELADALLKKGIPDEVIAEVLDRYDEVGIIDDAAFARAWVESRHHGKGLARRALSQELRRKGVDSETVAEALDELAPDAEEQTARELVERKVRTMRGEPDAVFRRLVGMLARKGYGPGVAYRIVKDVLDQRELGGDGEAWADALEAEAAEAEWERPDRV